MVFGDLILLQENHRPDAYLILEDQIDVWVAEVADRESELLRFFREGAVLAPFEGGFEGGLHFYGVWRILDIFNGV